MEPVTLVNPSDQQSFLITDPVEEHRLRSQGYHEPKPEVVVVEEPVEVPVEEVKEEEVPTPAEPAPKPSPPRKNA